MTTRIMATIIIIAVVVVIIIILLIVSAVSEYISENNERENIERKNKTYIPPTTQYTKNKISDCVSSDDVQYQIDYEVQRVIQNIEKNKITIQRALSEANTTVSTSWLNSYNKILLVSTNLNKNIENQRRKKLAESKFHYYTSLWFRSLIAADLAYKEYKQIEQSRNIFKKRRSNLSISNNQLDDTEKALNDLYFIYKKRVHELNRQTGELRDKIGRECGKQGAGWYAQIRENAIKRQNQ